MQQLILIGRPTERVVFSDEKQEGEKLTALAGQGAHNYTVSVQRTSLGYVGECTCPAYARQRNKPGPVIACVHLEAAVKRLAALLGENPPPISPPETSPLSSPQDTPPKPEETLSAPSPVEEEKPEVPVVSSGKPEKYFITHITPSRAPVIEKCAAAGVPPEGIQVRPESEPAALGRALHLAAEALIRGERITADLVAAEAGVPEDEDIRFLVGSLIQAWQRLRVFLPNPQTEVPLETTIRFGEREVHLSGIADVLSLSENSVTILDWKTGAKQPDYLPQLKLLGVLAAAGKPQIEKIVTILAWLREGTYSVAIFSRTELGAWLARFLSRAVWDGRTYVPGAHCVHCPRFVSCEGRQEFLRSGIQTLLGLRQLPAIIERNGVPVPAETIIRAYEQARLLESLIKDFRTRLREEIAVRGPIVSGSQVLGLKERPGPTRVIMKQAWPVLRQRMSEDEILEMLEVPVSVIKDAIAKRAPRGEKRAAIEAVLSELEVANALRQGPATTVLDLWEEAQGSA